MPILYAEIYTVVIPGHDISLHLAVSSLGPVQSAPPPFGLGLLQRRLIVLEPDPQVFEHGNVFSQAPHLPSTKSKYKKE